MRQTLVGLGRVFALMVVAALLLGGCAPGASSAARAAMTATPSVAPTPTAPPPTPTAAGTIAGQLAARAQQALGDLASGVDASYDARQAAATVTVTISGGVPNTDAKVAAAYAQVKQICYQTFPALWSSGVALREVTVLVLGPMQDEYANIITNWYGFGVIEAATAQRMRWAGLTPDAAWNLYDQQMLRASFVVAD